MQGNNEAVKLLNQILKEKQTLLNPQFNPQLIRHETDRKKHIFCQISYLMQRQELKDQVLRSGEMLTRTTHSSMHLPSYPEIHLYPENIIDIKFLINNIGTVVEGKILLCRTITPANQNIAIETIVEDPNGVLGVRLALYNYSTSDPLITDYDTVLPTGSILAIKNPWLKGSASGGILLRSDNPSHVELLSEKKCKELLPELKWKGSIPTLFPFYHHPNVDFWEALPQSYTLKVEALKKLGNIGFIERRFTDAIRFYSLSLDYILDSEDSVDILTNRAAAFLAIRCFNRALEDSRQVLEMKPFHTKAVYRQAKSLIGLSKHQEALEFLSQQMDFNEELSKVKEVLGIKVSLQHIVECVSKSTVEVDIMKLLNIRSTNQERTDEVLEYTGPIQVEEMLEHKGRGIVATEDILPGRLLICNKAFCIARDRTNKDQKVLEQRFNYESNSYRSNPLHDNLVASIAYKIHFEPENSGSAFYSLFAGPQLRTLPANSPESTLVSMKRIDSAVTFNAFGSPDEAASFPEIADATSFSGLWILPSLFNHSCVDFNASWDVFGDIMIIRAVKKIQKGKEILIAYADAEDYQKRMSIFRSHCFTCDCRLCLFEANQKEETKLVQQRGDLLSHLHQLNQQLETNSFALKKATNVVKKLEHLGRNYPDFNPCLMSECVQKFASFLFKYGHFKECRDLLNKIYTGNKKIGKAIGALGPALNILRCNLALNDKQEILNSIESLKSDLFLAYGSILPMKNFGKDTLQFLLQKGYTFFDDE